MVVFTIKEFDRILRTKGTSHQEGNILYLEPKDFDDLEYFVLENRDEEEGFNSDILQLSSKKGLGKCLVAKNYVGVVQTRTGTTIEILPKIYTREEDTNRVKKIFIKMLLSMFDIEPRFSDMAQLSSQRIPILELFIKMYLDELEKLIKKGIKSNYIDKKENEVFVKGKIILPEHMKRNFIRKDRFYLQYDEYLRNIPENRLIKTTLALLSSLTSDLKNSSRITQYQFYFDDVDLSGSIDKDLQKSYIDRTKIHYKTIIEWSAIFLKKRFFTSFKGHTTSIALMYPMEKIFENYVYKTLKRVASPGIRVYYQRGDRHLVETPKKFRLIPDIMVIKGEKKIIVDAKWKLLRSLDSSSNYGISQSDLYQMYAYNKKYTPEIIYLVYPETDNFKTGLIQDMSFEKEMEKISFIGMNLEKDFPDSSFASLLSVQLQC